VQVLLGGKLRSIASCKCVETQHVISTAPSELLASESHTLYEFEAVSK